MLAALGLAVACLWIGEVCGQPIDVRAQPLMESNQSLSINDLVDRSLEQHPGLQQLAFQIDAMRGRAEQAGLAPNPTLMFAGEELGGPRGSSGIQSLPFITQEVVTSGKLRLSRATLLCEVDQATLNWLAARYTQMARVRRGYFEILAAQRRVEILADLEKVAEKSLATARGLQAALEIAELDVIQFRVERNRYRAEAQAAREELRASFRRVAAQAGIADLEIVAVEDLFSLPDPEYDYESARDIVIASHPQLRAAQVGVSRAQWAWRRANVEPIPNLTVGAGYQRNNVDDANQWMFQLSMPLPVLNRNQGNRRAALAEVDAATSQIAAAENELVAQLATSVGEFDAARRRVREYRTEILPDAERALELATTAFQGGEFQYLRVLQAQRTLGETQLEFIRALAAMWQAAADLSGLLLEESWPHAEPIPNR